jgi:hypothetical protein
MPQYSLQITIWPTSNLQADASVANWSLGAADDASAIAAVPEFTNVHKGIQSYYSSLVRQSDHTWKLYDRADTPPRAPVATGTWSFAGAPAGDSLPKEVALCLSFQGAPLSGTPQSRRRGRIYMGPLRTSALGTDGRPVAGLITQLKDAGDNLLAASEAAASWIWVVYSPTSGLETTITNGWVDNEFDTQRRRGRVPTSRTTFS